MAVPNGLSSVNASASESVVVLFRRYRLLDMTLANHVQSLILGL